MLFTRISPALHQIHHCNACGHHTPISQRGTCCCLRTYKHQMKFQLISSHEYSKTQCLQLQYPYTSPKHIMFLTIHCVCTVSPGRTINAVIAEFDFFWSSRRINETCIIMSQQTCLQEKKSAICVSWRPVLHQILRAIINIYPGCSNACEYVNNIRIWSIVK